MSKTCKECGCQMEDNARFCPQCGCPVKDEKVSVPMESPMVTDENQDQNTSSEDKSYKAFCIIIIIGIFVALLFIVLSSGSRATQKVQDSNSVVSDTAVADTSTVIEQEPDSVVESEEQDIPTDFISGGNTYVGTRVQDVENLFDDEDHKKGDIIRYETHYTIQCYKDGTMTWSEDTSKNGGEPSHKKFEGEWKKETVSIHDVEYTWYGFWATTYDIHLNSHYSLIGFIDEKGQLYFEGANPKREIPANSTTFVLCKVSRQ